MQGQDDDYAKGKSKGQDGLGGGNRADGAKGGTLKGSEGKIGHKGGKGSKSQPEGQATKGAVGSQGKGKGKSRGGMDIASGGEWEVIAWHVKPAAFGCTRLVTTLSALEDALDHQEKFVAQFAGGFYAEAAAMMEGGCPTGSVLIKDGEACSAMDALQKQWPVAKRHVPGTMQGNTRLRSVWVCTFGTDTTLAPAVDFVKATAPRARRRDDTIVIRCVVWQGFTEEEKFKQLLRKPSQMARAWFSKIAPLHTHEFIDSWGWQSYGEAQARGLMRSAVALRSSGCWALGVALFFTPFGLGGC